MQNTSSKYSFKSFFLNTTTVYNCIWLLLLFMSSCGPCPEEQLEERFLEEKDLPVIGMYNTGNWWVYQSTDGLMKDSLYLLNTDTVIEEDRTNCIRYQKIEGEFAAFRNDQTFDVIGYYAIASYLENTFVLIISLSLKSGEMIQFWEEGETFNFDDTIIINDITFDKVKLLTNSSGDLTTIYKKNIGIFGWIDYNNQDTFYLTKYFVQ